MKRSELFFSFLLVPLDFAMIILAGASAYYIRFAQFVTEIRPIIFDLPFNSYFKVLFVVAVVWVIIFAFSGLYSIKGAKRIMEEVYKVFLACSAGLMAVVILIFARRELFDSRFIVLAGWILAIIYISIARGLVRWLQRHLFKFGVGVRKVIIVGESKTSEILIKEFSAHKSSAFNVVKRIKNFSFETAEKLKDYIRENSVDEIIQSDPNLPKSEVLRLYDFSDENHMQPIF